ncbi:MAG TPA: hypothetical protein VE987_12925 [Polyangiaceae bacterium]|nr:hypothetical protein [Polyangiaceae bacterium]
MRPLRTLRALALAASIVLPVAWTQTGCKDAAQAEASVFTTEEIACMVDGLVVGGLTGTPAQIAQGLQAVCQGRLQSLTQDVIAFVQEWFAKETTARARWADWARAKRETAQPPKPPAAPPAPPAS